MVVAVTTVHEDMHDGTGQQQQDGQRSNDMRQMLFQPEITGNRPDNEQSYRITRPPEWRRRFMVLMIVIHGGTCLFRGGCRLRIHHHLHHHLHHVHAFLRHLLTVFHVARHALVVLRTTHPRATHATPAHTCAGHA